VSPNVFREKGYRFYFLSNEEKRIYIHVTCEDGEAKYWLEPKLTLAKNNGFSVRDLRTIKTIIKEHENEIRSAWEKHFKG
jgi:hypothetical protein